MFLIATPIVGWVAAGVAAIGAGAYSLGEHLAKVASDTRNFGDGVSESTKKAACSYVKLRDDAIKSLNELAFATGDEAKKAVANAQTEFGKLTDEAIAALNKDKAKFDQFMNKFFGSATDAGVKRVGEDMQKLSQAYFASQEEAIRNTQQTMNELLTG